IYGNSDKPISNNYHSRTSMRFMGTLLEIVDVAEGYDRYFCLALSHLRQQFSARRKLARLAGTARRWDELGKECPAKMGRHDRREHRLEDAGPGNWACSAGHLGRSDFSDLLSE